MDEMTDEQIVEKVEEKMRQNRERAEKAIEAGKPALKRLFQVAFQDSGQPHHIRRFLLGMYNAEACPFELNRLRVLQGDLRDDCMALIEMDTWVGNQPYKYIKDGDNLMKEIWEMETTE